MLFREVASLALDMCHNSMIQDARDFRRLSLIGVELKVWAQALEPVSGSTLRSEPMLGSGLQLGELRS